MVTTLVLVLTYMAFSIGRVPGGNRTLPGSLATIIVVEHFNEHVHVSFLDFLKIGLPTAAVTLAIGATRLAWLR